LAESLGHLGELEESHKLQEISRQVFEKLAL
jgi:hypothetical protein